MNTWARDHPQDQNFSIRKLREEADETQHYQERLAELGRTIQQGLEHERRQENAIRARLSSNDVRVQLFKRLKIKRVNQNQKCVASRVCTDLRPLPL